MSSYMKFHLYSLSLFYVFLLFLYCCTDFDGLFLSNGPGDPTKCPTAIEIIKKWLNSPNSTKPVS